MAIMIAKTHTLPVIASHRSNFQGEIYTVTTPGYEDVVIAKNGRYACTCQECHGEPIREVKRQRATQATQAKCRELKQATFDLTYGDSL